MYAINNFIFQSETRFGLKTCCIDQYTYAVSVLQHAVARANMNIMTACKTTIIIQVKRNSFFKKRLYVFTEKASKLLIENTRAR